MAAIDPGEFLGQIADRLGLLPTGMQKLSKQIGKLELSDEEGERVASAVNSELLRIYGERHVADTMHVVKHNLVETPEVNDHWEITDKPKAWEPVEVDAQGNKWVNRPLHEMRLTLARNTCPDCGRQLLTGADQAGVPILLCSRLEGLRIALPKVTPHDIVACGLKAEAV